MPIHDWTRVDAGLFHAFHQAWVVSLSNHLNNGILPDGYFALIEQRINGPIPDVQKASRVAVHTHVHGRVVAVIEIVSPGSKASTNELRAFVEKARDLLRQGIHLGVIDLFPPTVRDSDGIHRAIWEDVGEEESTPRPATKPLTVVAYDAGVDSTAYLEHLAVGDVLPELPVFLTPGHYVNLPLQPN